MNDISRCRREVKRWLALVALTLAALLTGMVSAVTAPSPEAQEIANFLMIASVTAIICSLFGVKQSNDHCRSVQYGLSVFEAMKKDLEGTEIELTSARYDVTDAQSDLYFAKKNAEALQDELASVKSELEETRGRLYEAENELAQTQECLYRTENVLEETRDWLCETDDALVQTRDWLDEADRQLYKSWDDLDSAKSELREAKLELRRAGEYAEFNERCYESLRKEYSETTLDLLKTRRERDDLQSERDDLQSKLATARRFARRLLAERNELIAERDELRYQLVEARIGFEFFQGEYIKAGALIADAKEQIKGLESAVEVRDKMIGSLLDDVVIRTKG